MYKFIFVYVGVVVLRIEPGPLCILGKLATEVHPQIIFTHF